MSTTISSDELSLAKSSAEAETASPQISTSEDAIKIETGKRRHIDHDDNDNDNDDEDDQKSAVTSAGSAVCESNEDGKCQQKQENDKLVVDNKDNDNNNCNIIRSESVIKCSPSKPLYVSSSSSSASTRTTTPVIKVIDTSTQRELSSSSSSSSSPSRSESSNTNNTVISSVSPIRRRPNTVIAQAVSSSSQASQINNANLSSSTSSSGSACTTSSSSSSSNSSFLHSTSSAAPSNPFLRTSAFNSYGALGSAENNEDDDDDDDDPDHDDDGNGDRSGSNFTSAAPDSSSIFAPAKLLTPFSNRNLFDTTIGANFLRPSVLRATDSSAAAATPTVSPAPESVSANKTFISLNKEDIGTIKTPAFLKNALDSKVLSGFSNGSLSASSSSSSFLTGNITSDANKSHTTSGLPNEREDERKSADTEDKQGMFTFGQNLSDRVMLADVPPSDGAANEKCVKPIDPISSSSSSLRLFASQLPSQLQSAPSSSSSSSSSSSTASSSSTPSSSFASNSMMSMMMMSGSGGCAPFGAGSDNLISFSDVMSKFDSPIKDNSSDAMIKCDDLSPPKSAIMMSNDGAPARFGPHIENGDAHRASSDSVFKRKYEVITGEEDEQNVLSIHGKLYAWDTEKTLWIEKGRGHLRLNDLIKNDKLCSRLVMRTSGVLRVILNAHIVAGMKFELANDNCLRFTNVDGIYLIKANPKDIDQLNSAIEYRLREITKRVKIDQTDDDTGATSSGDYADSQADRDDNAAEDSI